MERWNSFLFQCSEVFGLSIPVECFLCHHEVTQCSAAILVESSRLFTNGRLWELQQFFFFFLDKFYPPLRKKLRMPRSCCVIGCTNTDKTPGLYVFRIPKIVKKQGEAHEQLLTERRNIWFSRISQAQMVNPEHRRVCRKHFISCNYMHFRVLTFDIQISMSISKYVFRLGPRAIFM